MSESMRVDPAALREAGRQHQAAADVLAAVPRSHPEIAGFVGSLGPVFGGFRAAVLSVLDQRRGCYEGQAQDHLGVTAGLHEAAGKWESHEAQAAQQMRGLRER